MTLAELAASDVGPAVRRAAPRPHVAVLPPHKESTFQHKGEDTVEAMRLALERLIELTVPDASELVRVGAAIPGDRGS
jgi:hypothetical protein